MDKRKNSDELISANKEISFLNQEKENRATELKAAYKEIAFQIEESGKRAAEFAIANIELVFQNKEKEKRVVELDIANIELAFQNEEKEKRAAELIIANKELLFQNTEKEKRAAELIIANAELAFQNEEKEKYAAELTIANTELAFQNKEKENRAAELIIANKKLLFEKKEKENRANELIIANKELVFQNKEKENRSLELVVAHKENEKIGVELITSVENEKRTAQLLIADKALVASEDRYRRLFEAAQDGILILNAETGVIEEVNPFMIEMLGYSHYEFLGKELWEIGLFSDINANKKAFLKLKEEGYIRYMDLPLKTKNGHAIWVEFVSNSYDVSGGQVIQCNIRDNTERKIAEDKLKAQAKALLISNTELQQFAYVASHDLQEPLRMITSFLGKLEQKYGGILDEKGKQYLFFAVDGAVRMRQIILDLLEFSKVDKDDDKLENIDLNVLVDGVLKLLCNQIDDKKAVFEIKKLPTIAFYKSPLAQIFQNLISNTLKYTKTDVSPQISIACKENESDWEISVADNGIGISEEYFDKIFILFQRLHNKNEYSGTGIGLAITKKIIEKKGGKIWVESEVGKGSTFYFTILK